MFIVRPLEPLQETATGEHGYRLASAVNANLPCERIGCSLRDWVTLDKQVKTDVSRYTKYTGRKHDRHQEWWWWCRCSSTLSFPKRPSDPLTPEHALGLLLCSHHAWPRLCSPVSPYLSRAQSRTRNFFVKPTDNSQQAMLVKISAWLES